MEILERAREQLLSFVAADGEPLALRIRVASPNPLAPVYDFALVGAEEWAADDALFACEGLRVLVDRDSVPLMRGARIDWIETRSEAGFRIDNPNLGPIPPELLRGSVEARVSQVLAERINPAVAAHGGRVELAGVEGAVAFLRMSGGCQGCGLAAVTLREGIEKVVLGSVPEVTRVEDVTDHARGSQPYFPSPPGS